MSPRRVVPEVMDDPTLDRAEHEAALRGLARLNLISGAASIVFDALKDLAPRTGVDGPPPLRVLDIATGGGDVPIALHRLARRRHRAVHLAGCDLSDVAIETARRRADAAGAPITFFKLDALTGAIPGGYDVIVSSLFMHHLSDERAEALLRRMAAAAQRRVIINDLRRGALSLVLVAGGAYLLSRSGVVHTDAVRSARAAFSIDEARALARRAGLRDAVVEPRFPARFVLTWGRR